jgi:hypothetical protein
MCAFRVEGKRTRTKKNRKDKEMEVKEFKEGTRVHMNDEPETNSGTITAIGGSRAHVSWDNGNSTNESLFDLTPIIPDTPKARVGKIIAYWNRKPTAADLAAVRDMVQAAINDCGLDATAEVAVDDADYHCVSLGHNPIKAVIKLNGTYPAVRMRNGSVVKGMDTITATFKRNAGVYDADKHHDLRELRAENGAKLTREEALAAGDAMPWEGEVVEFNARTNGHIRGYRCRTWSPYEGGVPGYGLEHIGGHFGYADTWENLKPDFAAYVRSIARDLGYEGRVMRKEVA